MRPNAASAAVMNAVQTANRAMTRMLLVSGTYLNMKSDGSGIGIPTFANDSLIARVSPLFPAPVSWRAASRATSPGTGTRTWRSPQWTVGPSAMTNETSQVPSSTPMTGCFRRNAIQPTMAMAAATRPSVTPRSTHNARCTGNHRLAASPNTGCSRLGMTMSYRFNDQVSISPSVRASAPWPRSLNIW
jgi:hypothetical protein